MRDVEKKVFDLKGFKEWISGKIGEEVNHTYAYDIINQIYGYGCMFHNVSKDQLATFMSDLLPEVSRLEVARFCDESILTEETKEEIIKKDGLECN